MEYDALNDTTGLYWYNLRITNIYPGGVRVEHPCVCGGARNVVNRSKSPFGAGWWLSGYEEVKKTYSSGPPFQYLWVGGDGSTRVFLMGYTLSYDRLDSLTLNSGTQVFTRWLPEGRKVEFNASGQHLRTTNRFGRVTTFTHTGSTLTGIGLPAPTGLSYTLAYTTVNGLPRLTSVTAPPLGVTLR